METVRLIPAEGEPSPRPPHFDSRYVLPAHRDKLLQTKHAHPRDSRIVFYEEPHIYTIDGHPASVSVSSLAAEFEKEFDANAAIQMMRKSKKEAWPRLKYVKNAKHCKNVDDLTNSNGYLMVDTSRNDLTVAAIHGDNESFKIMTGVEAVTIMRENAVVSIAEENEAWYTFDRAMTDEEIKKSWEENAEDARNRGTEAHLQMELWFNSEPCRDGSKGNVADTEVKIGLDFVRNCLVGLKARAYRTEWEIFGDDENVAGCIDLAVTIPADDVGGMRWRFTCSKPACALMVQEDLKESVIEAIRWHISPLPPNEHSCNFVLPSSDNRFKDVAPLTTCHLNDIGWFQYIPDVILIDWKRSEKLPSKMTGYTPMRPPLNHLDDCSGCAYALQLGCYQYILEKYYGINVRARVLASLAPAAPFTTAVPYLKAEVEFIMARRRAIVDTCRSLAATHPHLCCSHSGKLSLDPVVTTTAHGTEKLYDRKVAILHGISATPHREAKMRANELLEEHLPQIEVKGSKIRWKKLFHPTDNLLEYN